VSFATRAHDRLGDPGRRAAIARLTDHQADARVAALAELPDAGALRDRAAEIRERAIADLPTLLDRLQERLEAAGAVVHRAATAADAADTVAAIVRRSGPRVVKGKSMASEEIGLNERLEQEGAEVVETDLGELIVQLAGDRPEHLLAPALHRSRDDFRRLLEPLAGRPLGDDPAELAAAARDHLRGRFASAHVGITGVNFGIAETGTLVVVSNEGNGRLCASLPPVHVAVMGVERVVERMTDLAVLLPQLVRSATGQRLSSYVSLLSGPRRGNEADGPQEMHVVLLDNGRSRLAATRYRSVLRCIRCGACQNVCPVFRQVGGSAYGWVYGGPIGAVLTPLLAPDREYAELGHASSLCAACDDVCPVRIPLHDLLLDLRRDRAAAAAGRGERLAFRLWSAVWSRPWAYWLSIRLLPLLARLPGPGRRFTAHRDLVRER
jgi:L-lactate dehydrogenase complex protein LldF